MPASIDYLTTKNGIIPRLNHNNYPAWAKAIKFVLIGTDAWSIISGIDEEPDADAANTQRARDEVRDYQKRKNKALCGKLFNKE